MATADLHPGPDVDGYPTYFGQIGDVPPDWRIRYGVHSDWLDYGDWGNATVDTIVQALGPRRTPEFVTIAVPGRWADAMAQGGFGYTAVLDDAAVEDICRAALTPTNADGPADAPDGDDAG